MIKNSPANRKDIRNMDLTLGLGRPAGEGNGNPLKCSCLKNLMD